MAISYAISKCKAYKTLPNILTGVSQSLDLNIIVAIIGTGLGPEKGIFFYLSSVYLSILYCLGINILEPILQVLVFLVSNKVLTLVLCEVWSFFTFYHVMIYIFLSPSNNLCENKLFWGRRPLQVWIWFFYTLLLNITNYVSYFFIILNYCFWCADCVIAFGCNCWCML